MTYTLIIGNKNYSSWSMRAWLLMEFLELPYEEISIDLYRDSSHSEVQALGGETGLVPVLKDGEHVIWDTLAIFEYLYEDHPQVWPRCKKQRARARSICGEVHSALTDLREAMPVNTRARYQINDLSDGVMADIQRVKIIWEHCLAESDGPWLFGDFCAADIIFAPVATRFQTYGVELSGIAKIYQDRILSHPLVIKWLDLGIKEESVIDLFELPFAKILSP